VPWLDTVRAFRPHQLSDDLEKMLHERDVVGRQAWMRLFDETMADLRFDVDGKKLTSNEALNLLYEQDGTKRKVAADAVSKGLGDNKRVFALVTNTLAKEKEIDDKWRKFARPVSSRTSPMWSRTRWWTRSPRGEAPIPAAPLLQAQGQMVRRRHHAVLGPQRTAARA
jgi:oligoendopeptidase F